MTNEIRKYLFSQNAINKTTYRYDLLNSEDGYIDSLSIKNATISNNIFRDNSKRIASFEFDEYQQRNINFLNERIRPWMVLELPNGKEAKWSLGIFLLSSPTQFIKGKQKTRNIAAFDKTLVLIDRKLSEKLLIEKGKLYTNVITNLFEDSNIVSYKIEPSNVEIKADREFNIGVSIKEIINTLLSEINYNSLWVDANGWFICEPYVTPENRLISHKYVADEYSIMLSEMETSLDLLNRANVFVAYSVDLESKSIMRSKLVNDSPSSILSTVSRGREITKEPVQINNAPSQAILDAKVRQMMVEESTAYNHIIFSTSVMPTHGHGENIYLDNLNLSPIPIMVNETAWEINTDGTMKHECRRLLRL